jgi:ADP-ribose pyrophosphatase
MVRAIYPRGEVVREVVEHPGSVVIVPELEPGRYLLLRQHRISVGEVLLELPAGTIEAGEKPEDCAARELEEETGYKAGQLIRLARTYSTPGYSTETMDIFLARNLEKSSSKLESDEEIELMEMDREAVARAVREGEIRDLKTIAALFLAFSYG